VLPEDVAATLRRAHATLVAKGLDCTLDRRPRMVPHDPTLEAARAAVVEAWRQYGPAA
jgi:glutamate-ammonia-ligase adenylyltransferase